jgi:hypothetical protein
MKTLIFLFSIVLSVSAFGASQPTIGNTELIKANNGHGTNLTNWAKFTMKSLATNGPVSIAADGSLRTNAVGPALSIAADGTLLLSDVLTNLLGAPPPTNANAQQWSNLGTNNISNLIGATNSLDANVNTRQGGTLNGTNWSNLSTQNIANLIGATGALSTAVANLNGATGALSTAVLNLNGATGALSTAVANLNGSSNNAALKVSIQSGAANALTSTNQTSLASDTNQVAQRILSSSGYGRSTNTLEVLGPVGPATGTPSTNLVWLHYGTLTNAWTPLVIGVTWSNANVVFNALQVSVQDKGSASTSKLLDLGTNNGTSYTSKASVDKTGALSTSGSITVGTGTGTKTIAVTGIYASQRYSIQSAADGVIEFTDSAETGFNRLQFGGATAAFPGLGRTNGDLIVFGADGAFSGGSTNRLFVQGAIISQSTASIPTNTAAVGAVSNLFVLGTRYTNAAQRAMVSASFTLSAAAAGTAKVSLYVERSGITNVLTISAGPLASLVTVEPLLKMVGPGEIYYFNDETSGAGASVAIVANTCEHVRF